MAKKITKEQRAAAKNLIRTAQHNAQSTKDQFSRAMKDYDTSDREAANLAEVQFGQNSRQTADDRFAQAKKLQQAAASVSSSAGNALEGSGFAALGSMLTERNDLDTGEALGTLRTNQDSVRNALEARKNESLAARRDALNNAIFAVRGVEADTAAQLNTMNPRLFVKPGTGKTNLGAKKLTKKRGSIKTNQPLLSGYLTPEAR